MLSGVLSFLSCNHMELGQQLIYGAYGNNGMNKERIVVFSH